MTLGRTASGAIKIKTDDGTTRAVECACCGGCEQFDSLNIYLNGELMQKTGDEFIILPGAWLASDCSFLYCNVHPFTLEIEWYYTFSTGDSGNPDDPVPCPPAGSPCDAIYGGCSFDGLVITDDVYTASPQRFAFQDGKTPYGTFVFQNQNMTRTFIFSRQP